MANVRNLKRGLRSALIGGAIATIMSVPAFAAIDASIDIEKYINNVDADTEADAVNVFVGDSLQYKFRIANTGITLLNSILVTDSEIDLSGCSFPVALAAGQVVECTLFSPALEGLNFDLASVTGQPDIGGSPVMDSDPAYYRAPEQVPEPGTLALLGLGLAGLAASWRRKLN